MPSRPALGVREAVAGHRLGVLEGGVGYPPPPSNASLPPSQADAALPVHSLSRFAEPRNGNPARGQPPKLLVASVGLTVGVVCTSARCVPTCARPSQRLRQPALSLGLPPPPAARLPVPASAPAPHPRPHCHRHPCPQRSIPPVSDRGTGFGTPPPPRDALEGGRYPPPPFRAPSLCPATVPRTPSAGLDGICNRQ